MLKANGCAYYDGVQKCRARICPVCWISRRAQLAHEITYVVGARVAATHRQPLLATLTVRHSAADPVSLCRAVRVCWRQMISGRDWKEHQARFGFEWIAAEEVTRGEHGWHPHMHVLLLPGPGSPPIDLVALNDWWFERWYAIVGRVLGCACSRGEPCDHHPTLEHGADLRACDRADYLSKLGLQMTDSGAVKGKSPIVLLEAGELDSYVKLQLSRHRAKDVTWSRGLRTLRDQMPTPLGAAELVLRLRGSEWGRLLGRGEGAVLDVLDAAEDAGDARFVAQWWLGPLAKAAN